MKKHLLKLNEAQYPCQLLSFYDLFLLLLIMKDFMQRVLQILFVSFTSFDSAALALTKALLIYQQTMLFSLCCLLCEFLLTLIMSDLCLQSPEAFLVKFRRAKAGRLVLYSSIPTSANTPLSHFTVSISLLFCPQRVAQGRTWQIWEIACGTGSNCSKATASRTALGIL